MTKYSLLDEHSSHKKHIFHVPPGPASHSFAFQFASLSSLLCKKKTGKEDVRVFQKKFMEGVGYDPNTLEG